MFPEQFIKRIKTQDYLDADSLIRSLKEPSPVSIRINPGKWQHVPAITGQVPWCKTGFYLQSRPSFTLDPLFHSGCYYPREASGMFLEQVFLQCVDHAENLRVLDLCAAPGGKSTQLSDLIGNNSLLISNEVIRSRSYILSETISKWGKGNTIVTQNDPFSFAALAGYFDMIMIDAPCSGEGMFRDRTAVDEWSPGNLRLCEERQKRIISEVWPSLKENGLLIYSTCTFNPGENEENIAWIRDNNQAEIMKLDISAFRGVTEIDYKGIYGYGFYPGKIRGEGFFISVIRKKDVQDSANMKISRKNEINPDKADISISQSWMRDDPSKLLRMGDNLFMLPCRIEEFMWLSGKLNIVSPGTLIGTRKKNDLIPSHELALSQKISAEAFPSTEVGYRDALHYLRRDNLIFNDLQVGWNLLTFKGINLGFVKNIGKRINNYFPVAWRIRMDLPEQGQENVIKWIVDE